MTTRDIRTSHAHTVCDVCGRTLLRGERAETYINGGARREVCELCKTRALHEGWVREGTLPDYSQSGSSVERRRSLFGKFRQKRAGRQRTAPANPTLDDELAGHEWAAPPPGPVPADPVDGYYPPYGEPPVEDYYDERWDDQAESRLDDPEELGAGPDEYIEEPPARRPSRRPTRPRRAARPARRVPREQSRAPRSDAHAAAREPRHVRAVPTSDDQKIVAAIDLFNQSEHRRTVAGVARSLGGPAVSVLPVSGQPSLVQIAVCWELCWYRYAVDLSDAVPGVRVEGQGYELSELPEAERQAVNAAADDTGQLTLR